MKRRASKFSTSTHSGPREQAANHCRAVVRVDGTDIRKKIRRDYEKALRDLENSRRQLDQFHQRDLPVFTRWLNSHFGALLTELRELSQKMAADEELIFLVQNEVLFGGGSHARAYKRVMGYRENPEPPPPPPEAGDEPDGNRDPFAQGPEADNFDGETDPLDEFFDEIFGKFGPDDHAGGKRPPRSGHHAGSAVPPAASARLKGLYRALVRRLHPDVQQEMTAEKLEWWHQTQAAYEAGDAEQLEVILTLCEIGESGTTAHTSPSLLQRITAKLKSSLREIKRQMAGLRSDPAWNFSRRSDHEVMALQMGRTLKGDLQEMRERWRETQELIAGWKAAAENLKKPRRRKRPAQSAEFLF